MSAPDPREWDDAKLAGALRCVAEHGDRMLASQPFTMPWPPQWNAWDMSLMLAAAERLESRGRRRLFARR